MYYLKKPELEKFIKLVPEIACSNSSKQFWVAKFTFDAVYGYGLKHNHDSNGCSISSESLKRSVFTKNTGDFKRIVEQAGLFDVSNNWYKGKDTRIYYPTEKAKQIVHDCKSKGALINENGKPIRMSKHAISSRDINGNPRKTNGNISAFVSINQVELKKLKQKLLNNPQFQRFDGLCDKNRIKTIERMIGQTEWLLHTAQNSTKPGEIYQPYHESNTGRIIGIGHHLQNTMREVRAAALVNNYDYDIENCHFTFLYQLAQRYGYESSTIKYYLDNKNSFRKAKAAEYELPESVVKKILIAMIYGATLTKNTFNEIGQILLDYGCGRIVSDPDIRQLEKEIIEAGRFVLANTKKSKGLIKNVVGKFASTKKPDRKQVAHILQGYEAKALMTAVKYNCDSVILLAHDGFVTKERINVVKTTVRIQKALNMEINISENRISNTTTQPQVITATY